MKNTSILHNVQVSSNQFYPCKQSLLNLCHSCLKVIKTLCTSDLWFRFMRWMAIFTFEHLYCASWSTSATLASFSFFRLSSLFSSDLSWEEGCCCLWQPGYSSSSQVAFTSLIWLGIDSLIIVLSFVYSSPFIVLPVIWCQR